MNFYVEIFDKTAVFACNFFSWKLQENFVPHPQQQVPNSYDR